MKYTVMPLLLAAVATGGCATVVRGAKDTAKFESEPAGATVSVESISADKLGPFSCVTPCELELKRKREWKVTFSLDGYKPAAGTLAPKVSGGGVASGVGNVLAGGIIGIGVDAGTGANLDLRPNPMRARMSANDSLAASVVLTEKEEKVAKGAKSKKSNGAKDVDPADETVPVETAPVAAADAAREESMNGPAPGAPTETPAPVAPAEEPAPGEPAAQN